MSNVDGVRSRDTRAQDAILSALRRAAGQVVNSEQLNAAVYGRAAESYRPSSIRQYVTKLRRRLEEQASIEVIENVRGLGYRLRSPSIVIPAATRTLPPTGPISVDEYRDALDRLGLLSGWAFCNALQLLGDTRPRRTIMRLLQEFKSPGRKTPLPWTMCAIVRLMEREAGLRVELAAQAVGKKHDGLGDKAGGSRYEDENRRLQKEVHEMAQRNDELNRMLVAAASRTAPTAQRAG